EEDHVGERMRGVVLRRHVHLIGVRRARKKFPGRERVPRNSPPRHAGLWLRVGAERVVERGQVAGGCLRHQQQRGGEDFSHRFEGIFGFSPRAVISFVKRSTARSTGRLSAIEIGVRPAAFSSSSFAPWSARNWITSHTSGCVRPFKPTATCITVLPVVVTASTCGSIS